MNRILCLLCLVIFFNANALSSDHADPIFNKSNEADLTGLFVFPKEDSIIFVLTVYAGLKTPPPYKLKGITYQLFIDTQSLLSFDKEEDRFRYGGSVVRPEKIDATASIAIQLNDDTTIASTVFDGFTSASEIELWSGVRDDPFIFPKFFGSNVIAIVAKIPLGALPDKKGQFLAWATTSEKYFGKLKQIDHVGRAARTQNPRLDFLNTLHPSEHLAEIKKQHDYPSVFKKELMKYLQPLFAIRHYDFFPDVLIYSHDFPAGYPNGRKLSDDIAALSCESGDCMLRELSFADSEKWPRETQNDKPFLTVMPYLAEPF